MNVQSIASHAFAPQPLVNRVLASVLSALMITGAMIATPVYASAETVAKPHHEGTARSTAPPGGFEAVMSFEVGDGPGRLGIAGGEEFETWGPASFAVDEKGRFYVVDGVNGRIVIADPTGGSQVAIAWDAPVVCPVDIEVVSGRIFVLDLPAQPAAVHEICESGTAVATWEVPAEHLEHGVSGLDVRLDRSGAPDIRLEIAGTWHVPLATRGARPARLPAVIDGAVMRVPAAAAASVAIERGNAGRAFSAEKDWATGRSANVTALSQGRAVAVMRVDSRSPLGAVRYVDSDRSGNAYVYAEDLVGTGERVRAFVKRYEPDGAPAARFEIPVTDFVAHPMRPIRIAEDGTAYVLVPRADRVSIVRAQWIFDTSEALPASDDEAPATRESLSLREGVDGVFGSIAATVRSVFTPQEAVASWTPLNANDRAWTYVRHAWYCSTRNFATRNGSQRPRYITSANRNYTAVPYCWGGFDTTWSYNSAMSAGHSAGDINCTGTKRSGTAGVDCSGFVSRLWGLGRKYGTWELPNVSRSVSKTAMRLGDAYVWPGRHCMFFRYYTTGGSQLFESTKTSSYDRVVTMSRTSAALANYGAFRYRNW